MKLAPADVFEGKYRIVRMLGKGGMGAVYEVEHLRVPGRYALKLMLPELGHDESFRERFFREIAIARGLVHPNVVTIRDCDVAGDGSCYFTMDLSPGVPLSKLVPLEWRRALAIVRQVLLALGEAHRRGIVHRDIKPDNVLVEGKPPREQAKVLDFGIARALGEDGLEQKTLTTAQGIVGTPAYISPEQALGEKVDGRSDLYSTGVMLHKLVTGLLPFRSDTPTGFYGQHIAVAPPPIRSVKPDLGFPEGLERLVLRSLEKEREQRFASADEMIDAIDQLLGVPPARAVTPYPTPPRGPASQPHISAYVTPSPTGVTGAGARAAPAGAGGTIIMAPAAALDRARLVFEGPAPGMGSNAPSLQVFLFALERVPFGRSRPKTGSGDENALVIWLLPARSEQEDPENFRATLEISGRHGELFFRDGAYFVTDRSTRGTTLDGAAVPKAQERRLPERFRLGLGGVLELDGRVFPAPSGGGAAGLVLRRVRNCEHHVYALLRGPVPLPVAVPGAEDATIAPRPGGGFELSLRGGAPRPLSLGERVEVGALKARLERLGEADMRAV